MEKLIFVNVIADGPVDFKKPLTAEGQPSIREYSMIFTDGDQVIAECEGPSSAALGRYSEAIASGAVVVGHSVEYHHAHLRADMIANGIDPCDGRVKTACTMLGLAGHGVKPGGRNGWPKFGEVCDHFGITRASDETAADNARCLLQAFRSAQGAGIQIEHKVWKERSSK